MIGNRVLTYYLKMYLHMVIGGTMTNPLMDAWPAGDQKVEGSTPAGSVTFFHEIFPTVILSLPLIQEGQLSVSGERMCTILVKPAQTKCSQETDRAGHDPIGLTAS